MTGVPIEGTTSMGFLGGAPTNFTVMAGRLGNHAAILSRIGRDNLGRLAIDQLDPIPVDTSRLEVDLVHETGRVTVNFVEGEPKYTIHKPAAWDFMELTGEWVSWPNGLTQFALDHWRNAAQNRVRQSRLWRQRLRHPAFACLM